MTDELVDYTKLSGAEFSRAVGVDPEKWAAAYLQNLRKFEGATTLDRQVWTMTWFRDAMEAARAEARRFHRIGEGE